MYVIGAIGYNWCEYFDKINVWYLNGLCRDFRVVWIDWIGIILLKSVSAKLCRFAYSLDEPTCLGKWVDLHNYAEHWSAELCRFANSLGE